MRNGSDVAEIMYNYTQKTPKRGEHSWDQGIVSLEAIFSKQIERKTKKKKEWKKS